MTNIIDFNKKKSIKPKQGMDELTKEQLSDLPEQYNLFLEAIKKYRKKEICIEQCLHVTLEVELFAEDLLYLLEELKEKMPDDRSLKEITDGIHTNLDYLKRVKYKELDLVYPDLKVLSTSL